MNPVNLENMSELFFQVVSSHKLTLLLMLFIPAYVVQAVSLLFLDKSILLPSLMSFPCVYGFSYLKKDHNYLVFQTIFKEIQNQFGRSIRILRSDNAKEFFSAPFNSFLANNGVIHQSFYPYNLNKMVLLNVNTVILLKPQVLYS